MSRCRALDVRARTHRSCHADDRKVVARVLSVISGPGKSVSWGQVAADVYDTLVLAGEVADRTGA